MPPAQGFCRQADLQTFRNLLQGYFFLQFCRRAYRSARQLQILSVRQGDEAENQSALPQQKTERELFVLMSVYWVNSFCYLNFSILIQSMYCKNKLYLLLKTTISGEEQFSPYSLTNIKSRPATKP